MVITRVVKNGRVGTTGQRSYMGRIWLVLPALEMKEVVQEPRNKNV